MNPDELLALPGVEQLEFGQLATPAEAEDDEELQALKAVTPDADPEQQPVQAGDLPLAGIAQGIDGLFGTNLTETYVGAQQQGQEDNAEREAAFRENTDGTLLDNTVGEVARATAGGTTGIVEETVKAADLAGDTFNQLTGRNNGDQTQNPFSDEYERSNFNLGIAENKTLIGGFARNAITMLGFMKGLRGVPGVGGIGTGANSTVATRMGGEALRGAIADFIIDPGEGNLSNMVEEQFGLEDNFITALAHEDEDNIYIQKLKNMAEGGLFGLGTDAIGEVYSAFRAGRKAKAEGKSIEEAVDATINKAEELEKTKTPDKKVHLEEAKANNADSVQQNLWEPNERAAKTSKPNIQDVIEDQTRVANDGNPAKGSARMWTTDETYKYLVANPNEREAMASLIKAAADGVDLNRVAKMAEGYDMTNPRQLEAIPVLKALVDDGFDLTPLKKMVASDTGSGTVPEYMTIKGGIATRALMLDTANQLKEISSAAKGVDDIGGDAWRQQEMLLDRLQALTRMDVEASYSAGASLQGRKNTRFNARKAMDGEAALKQTQSDETITKMREALQSGDPAAKKNFESMVDGLVMAEGDPSKTLKFWELWRQNVGKNLQSALYNGYLGTTTSQLRNLTGNAVNTALRPMAQAIGFGVTGNKEEARVALAAFHGMREMLGESYKIFKTSLADTASDSQVVRFETSNGTARQAIDKLKADASTTGEKAAATFVEMQYNLFNHPWMRMPTRALGAADDAVRVLVARMTLKQEAMRTSLEHGGGFRVDMDRYQKLVDLKIDGKGNILDQQLLDAAKDVTFQRDLEGLSKSIQDLSNNYPAMKPFLPFIKTPTNVLMTTASYMPGWTRIPGSTRVPIVGVFAKEYRAAMAGNDEALKAIYRGREAIGLMAMTTATGLASAGLITGNGPRDRQKRELWLKTNQPNSIKTPFGWVNYETIEPLNTIFSMAADLTQLALAGNDTLYERSWAQAAYTLSASVTSKSYFQSLNEALQMTQVDDPRWGKLAQKTALGLTNTLVLPLAGTRAQLSKAMAPGYQEFDSELQKAIASAVPGMRNVLGTNKTDIFTGKDIGPGMPGHLWNTFTPFDVTNTDNPVAQQLGELGVDVSTSFADTFGGIELSAKEKNTLNRYIYETGVGSQLKVLMDNDKFKASVEAWKASGATLEPEPQWHKQISRKLAQAKKSAKARMLRDNPTFAAKVNLNRRASTLARTARYDESQETLKQLERIIDF